MIKTPYEIGVIGAGNAAEGIVDAILRKSVLMDDRMIAGDPSPLRRELFANRFKIQVTDDNRSLVENSYILILAVKPQIFQDVCNDFADLVREDHVIVSIMAGVSTATIERQFPNINARVIRVMPNLPIHVGAGVAGIHPGSHATEADLLRAQRIFDAGGRCIVVEDEDLMNAVTAISGSGPAYFYYFVEALIAAGEAAGLSHQESSLLARYTCLGAARMMLESDDSPAELRQKVTSPGGTTQAALESMAKNKVFELIQEGALAALHRARELGQ